ncbi:MAG: S-methyl-5-thioribose kinase [Sneathiella sp.]
MEYRQLNVDLVPDFIRGLAEMQVLFSSFDDLEVVEVGDGNLNFVYIVTNKDARDETVILKQAVPFLRIAGEGWPLSRERMKNEVMALKFHESLCPANVPKIYYSSDEMSLVIMENLKNHQIIRGEIVKGKIFPYLADHVSSFMAKTLFHSSDLYLGHDQKKRDVAKTINIELCKITEDFVFTHPFEDNETNEYNPELSPEIIAAIQRDPKLRAAVGEMKYAFMTKAEALLHGDFHIGSIMANEEETFVIDPEFSFYGPMGFDLGAMIGNLFLAYFSHDYRQRQMGNDPAAYRTWLLNCAKEVWCGFEEKFLELWRAHDAAQGTSFIGRDLDGKSSEAFRVAYMSRVFEDMIGFAACKMMRRIVGLAKVADIADIDDATERARAEANALRMGSVMVLQRSNYSNFDELTDLAKSISPLGGSK